MAQPPDAHPAQRGQDVALRVELMAAVGVVARYSSLAGSHSLVRHARRGVNYAGLSHLLYPEQTEPEDHCPTPCLTVAPDQTRRTVAASVVETDRRNFSARVKIFYRNFYREEAMVALMRWCGGGRAYGQYQSVIST